MNAVIEKLFNLFTSEIWPELLPWVKLAGLLLVLMVVLKILFRINSWFAHANKVKAEEARQAEMVEMRSNDARSDLRALLTRAMQDSASIGEIREVLRIFQEQFDADPALESEFRRLVFDLRMKLSNRRENHKGKPGKGNLKAAS